MKIYDIVEQKYAQRLAALRNEYEHSLKRFTYFEKRLSDLDVKEVYTFELGKQFKIPEAERKRVLKAIDKVKEDHNMRTEDLTSENAARVGEYYPVPIPSKCPKAAINIGDNKLFVVQTASAYHPHDTHGHGDIVTTMKWDNLVRHLQSPSTMYKGHEDTERFPHWSGYVTVDIVLQQELAKAAEARKPAIECAQSLQHLKFVTNQVVRLLHAMVYAEHLRQEEGEYEERK